MKNCKNSFLKLFSLSSVLSQKLSYTNILDYDFSLIKQSAFNYEAKVDAIDIKLNVSIFKGSLILENNM